MKTTLLTFLFLALSLVSSAQNKANSDKFVTLTGYITGETTGYSKIYLYGQAGQAITPDSAVIENGKFYFKIPYSKPFMPLFYAKYESKGKGGRGYIPYGLLLDKPCNLTLKDINLEKGLGSGTLSGSKTAVLFHNLNKKQEGSFGKINEIVNDLKKNAKPGEDLNAYSYGGAKFDSVIKIQNALFYIDMVKSYPDEFASTYILSGSGGSGRSLLSVEQLEKCYTLLSDRMKKTDEGKIFFDYIQMVKNSAVGKMVANFILPDPDGKDIDFSTLKGKYVLIDFWASWCGPCRKSFPHMRELYKMYKGNNFEILSVSIDKDRAAWLKAVGQENNPWLQVHDTKNVSQKGFAVAAVPTCYLIDPQGKIIMKEMGFEVNSSMTPKLAELFGGKVSEPKAKQEKIEKKEDDSIPAMQLK